MEKGTRVAFAVAMVATAVWVGSWAMKAGAEDQSPLGNLASLDADVRGDALDALEAAGSDALGYLLSALDDDRPALVKAGIAEAIRRIGVTTSEASDLAALLSDVDPATRQAAVAILADAPSLARPALEAVARDEAETASIRAGAAQALGGAGTPARSTLKTLAEAEATPSAVRHGALRGLARTGGDGVADVARLAADRDRSWADREVAVWALAQSGVDGAAALLGLTKSTATTAPRAAAVAALASLGNSANGGDFATLTGDTSPAVRLAALRGLWEVGAAVSQRTALLARLADGDPRVVALAARISGATCGDNPGAATTTLTGLLAHTNFRVRYEAVGCQKTSSA